VKAKYGWVIAFCAMVTLWVTNGIIIPGITAFDPALLEEFGWGRGDLKLRDLLTFVLAGLLGPLAGAVADRFGVKRMMLFGAALLAVCLYLYGRIGSLTHVYAIHVGFAFVLLTCGLIVAMMLVSHWFVRHRGTAIGLALVGTSFGGMFFPKLATWLIGRHGWREAFTWEILFPVGLFVLILVLVRSKPSDIGLEPVGHDHAQAPAAATGLEFAEAIKTPTFWALAAAAMATFYSILGFSSNLILHLRDLGFEPQKAASGLSLLFLLALIGKFVFGFLADHLNKKWVFIGNIAVMLVGALLLATMNVGVLWVAIMLFALGWGGLYTLIQLLTVDTMGLKAAGKILGTITTFDAIGGGLGIWLTGYLYDRTGSYQSAFIVVAVLIALALGAATQVRSYVR